MSASILLKFVNPETGPVISITSTPYPDLLRRKIWQSTAKLHPDCGLSGEQYRIFNACGGGWSKDKEQSQCKAVTEAIERWAYRYYYRSAKTDAALGLDPTSNGFAALPRSFSNEQLVTGAYCEALERWALSRIWDYSDINLDEFTLKNDAIELFGSFKGKLHCFSTRLKTQTFEHMPHAEAIFALCVFETNNGGAIPGSACGIESSAVHERAITEAFINLTAFDLMKKKNLKVFEDILEQRLDYFGNRKTAYAEICGRISRKGNSELPDTPKVVFSKRLDGPWAPDVMVHRVLVDGTLPVTQGGVDRFVI